MLTIERWRVGELTFTDPAAPHTLDTGIRAVFRGPSGREIDREAFWDGGDTFKVRFAPTEEGLWTYAVTGLAAGEQSGELTCVPYAGELDMYRHGFLKVGPQGRYLCHADNTPFFWLGDTHWLFAIRELWDESGDPEGKYDSQFRAIVDRRAEQGFNVYQCNFHCGDARDGEPDRYFERTERGLVPKLDFLKNDLDRKMAYLADKGFAIAAGFSWFAGAFRPGALEYYKAAARYLIARYGAYPMIWTLAGEVAGYSDVTRTQCIDFWREIALEIEKLDTYGHLQTAHYTNERPFADYYQGESWFDFTLNQAGHGDFPVDIRWVRRHLAAHPGKPFVEGESLYEQVLTLEPMGRRRATPEMLRRAAYLTVQAGGCGYTYGCQGMWHIQLEEPQGDPGLGFGSAPPWYRGIDFPGAYQMGIMKRFYESVNWASLRPLPKECFGLASEGALVLTFDAEELISCFSPAITANDDMTTIVAYFAETNRYRTVLRTLTAERYEASWFDPGTGIYTPFPEPVVPVNGVWTAPTKPTGGDAVLVLRACPA